MDAKPRRRADVSPRSLDERETILYDPQTDSIHVLNPAARIIWELCDGEHTVDDIAIAVTERFSGVNQAQALADVKATVSAFAEKGLLRSDK